MRLEFLNLGSGSSGNCTYLKYGNTSLLIDLGFSCKKIKEKLVSNNIDPCSIDGILITHGHSDHIKGLGLFCKERQIPVYCNLGTQTEILAAIKRDNKKTIPTFKIFNTGDRFSIKDISIDTFRIPHDTSDPVGYMFKTVSIRVGVVTDLGKVTTLVTEHIRGAYALLFESNHDVDLLRHSNRPWSSKQRTLSSSGHLSNEQSATALDEIAMDGLKEIVLGHLSGECNTPDMALETALNKLQGKEVNVRVSSQDGSTYILPTGFDV